MEKKGSNYFQHDFYARNDPKLSNLIVHHGVKGVGVYWCLVENLYEQGGKLSLSTCKSIAFSLHVDVSIVESIIKDFSLFVDDGKEFWSESIIRRLEKQESIRSKRKAAVMKRWQNKEKQEEVIIEEPDDEVQVFDPSTTDDSSPAEQINFKGLVKFWNDGVKKYGSAMKPMRDMNGTTRKNSVRARIRENGKKVFADTLIKALQSDFLNGKNDRSWIATFDWIILPNNFVKVRDGNYECNQVTPLSNGTINQNGSTAESRYTGAANLVSRLLEEGELDDS